MKNHTSHFHCKSWNGYFQFGLMLRAYEHIRLFCQNNACSFLVYGFNYSQIAIMATKIDVCNCCPNSTSCTRSIELNRLQIYALSNSVTITIYHYTLPSTQASQEVCFLKVSHFSITQSYKINFDLQKPLIVFQNQNSASACAKQEDLWLLQVEIYFKTHYFDKCDRKHLISGSLYPAI